MWCGRLAIPAISSRLRMERSGIGGRCAHVAGMKAEKKGWSDWVVVIS